MPLQTECFMLQNSDVQTRSTKCTKWKPNLQYKLIFNYLNIWALNKALFLKLNTIIFQSIIMIKCPPRSLNRNPFCSKSACVQPLCSTYSLDLIVKAENFSVSNSILNQQLTKVPCHQAHEN